MSFAVRRLTIDLAIVPVVLAFGALGMFGVIGSTLLPLARGLFGMDMAVAFAVQWVPLVAGGVFALPLGRVQAALGSVRTMQSGLATSLIGCLFMAGLGWHPRPGWPGYALLLSGLVILALGSTALQVSINPLMLGIGPRQSGASRLVLA